MQVRTIEMVAEKSRICKASSQTIVVTCVRANNDALKNKRKEANNPIKIQRMT